MFGLFEKKKIPQNLIDEFIFAVYGNPPPAKRANLSKAVILANELLMNMIDNSEVCQHAIILHKGPIPFSTHDLALSLALYFFSEPEYLPQLGMAQLFARMKVLQWGQEVLVNPILVENFENSLYELYKS